MSAAIFVFVTVSNAQKLGYSKGDKLLNIGLGLNSSYSGGLPIGISFEIGITDAISIGPNTDYFTYNYSGYKFTALYFGVRGSYHFNELLKINDSKVDLYGGLNLGYRSFSWNDNFTYSADSYGSGIYLGGFIGGKYYFAEKVGGFVELGAIGSTNARIGVAFKF